MKYFNIIILAVLVFSCTDSSRQNEWRFLFNGKDLTGWDTYLGPHYSEEKEDFDGEHIGLNNDPYSVFSVVEEDGTNVIRISGEVFGGLSTIDSFEKYHLQLQYKWGEAKHKPRDNSKRDSGLLYHAHGQHGVEWFFWMKSMEMQVQDGDCGDFWALSSEADIRARMNPDSSFRYDPDGQLTYFGSKSDLGGNVKKFPDGMEKAHGQWNTLDLYSFGQTSMHVVNGTLVMVLENAREIIDGKEMPLTKGKIQIQSEGAEIFYRDIKIRPISALPDKL